MIRGSSSQRLMLTLLITLITASVSAQTTTTVYGDADTTGGSVRFWDVDFLTARSSTVGFSADAVTNVGIDKGASYYVNRGFLTFQIPADVGTIAAAHLDGKGLVDYSTDDFDIGIFATTYDNIDLVIGAFNDFQGWKSGSQVYTPDSLHQAKFNSVDFVVGYGNIINFSSTGIDSITAHIGSDLKICLLGYNDKEYSVPANAEALRFDTSTTWKLVLTVTGGTSSITTTRSRGRVLREATGTNQLLEGRAKTVINKTKK